MRIDAVLIRVYTGWPEAAPWFTPDLVCNTAVYSDNVAAIDGKWKLVASENFMDYVQAIGRCYIARYQTQVVETLSTAPVETISAFHINSAHHYYSRIHGTGTLFYQTERSAWLCGRSWPRYPSAVTLVSSRAMGNLILNQLREACLIRYAGCTW